MLYIIFIIIILISIAGVFFVISAKLFEMRSGQVSAFGRLSATYDPKLRNIVEKIKFFLSHFHMANAKKVLTTGAHNLFHIFGTAGLFVSKHHKNLTSRINGKREIKSGGVVSFFLKHVAESKGEEEKKDL